MAVVRANDPVRTGDSVVRCLRTRSADAENGKYVRAVAVRHKTASNAAATPQRLGCGVRHADAIHWLARGAETIRLGLGRDRVPIESRARKSLPHAGQCAGRSPLSPWRLVEPPRVAAC